LRILAQFPFELKVQSPPEDWVGRLSITTPAPAHKLGTKKCSTKTENSLPFIDPFSVIIPTTFFQIIAPTTVIFAPKKWF
jgi:hypothetical protein